jgi:hypothetical protein
MLKLGKTIKLLGLRITYQFNQDQRLVDGFAIFGPRVTAGRGKGSVTVSGMGNST